MSTKPQLKKVKQKVIQAADLFCGAGGTSSGFVEAVQGLGYDFDLVAVNHWDVAIQTHSRNHEKARHLCQSIDTINPQEVVPGKRLHILMASPECTDHSNAKGGKPRSDQKRADAWLLMRWIEKLYVENLIIENVKEFVNWGPLNAKGLPDKRHRGKYFRQFVEALEINYTVKWTILNAADYGDATTRQRFFLIAKRGKKKTIVFPEPTHTSRANLEKAQPSLFNGGKALKPWRSAREIIDWDLKGESIFNRKKPLSENTMRRIFAGLFKYSLKEFIVNLKGMKRHDRSVEEPLFTQTTGSHHQYLAEPYLVQFFGERNGQKPRTRDVGEPLWTVTAQGRMGVAEPFLINYKSTELRDRSIDEPIPTQTAEGKMAVIEPFVVNLSHTSNNDASMCKELENPLPVICGKGMLGLIEPFLVKFFGGQHSASVDNPIPTITANYEHYGIAEPYLIKYHGNESEAHSINEPLSTVTTKDRVGLAEPFIIPCNHGKGDERAYSVDEPMKTITQVDAWGMVEPFLVKLKKNQDAQSLDEPLGTLTTKDSYALCIPQLDAVIDIRFRMLQPHELAEAMGFPKSYSFAGTRDQKVRQIGNAVPVNLAKALVKAVLEN